MNDTAEMSDDEAAALTSADLLSRLQAVESRLEASTTEKMKNLERRIERTEAAKLRTLERHLTEAMLSKRSLLESEEEAVEEDTFPDTTFSFFLFARYPLCNPVRENSENSEKDNDAVEDENPSKSKKCPDIDWESSDALFFPFWLAGIVLICQVAIYWLVFVNATDIGGDNPFRIPIGVDPWTRAAEFFAIAITVYTQGDFFEGIVGPAKLIFVYFCFAFLTSESGRQSDLFFFTYEVIHKAIPSITKPKYYFTAVTEILLGCFGIVVTFILIMQSNEVVDSLLNFTAMEFVAVQRSCGLITQLHSHGIRR